MAAPLDPSHVEPTPDSPRIVAPCPLSLADLRRDGTRLHCDVCRRDVIDTTRLTRRDTLAMLEQAAESVCMRVAYDANGRSVHVEDAPATHPEGPRRPRRLAWATAMLLAACAPDPRTTNDAARDDTADTSATPRDVSERDATRDATTASTASSPLDAPTMVPTGAEPDAERRDGELASEVLADPPSGFQRQPVPLPAPGAPARPVVVWGGAVVLGRAALPPAPPPAPK